MDPQTEPRPKATDEDIVLAYMSTFDLAEALIMAGYDKAQIKSTITKKTRCVRFAALLLGAIERLRLRTLSRVAREESGTAAIKAADELLAAHVKMLPCLAAEKPEAPNTAESQDKW